jgi:putative restriction endonuclease
LQGAVGTASTDSDASIRQSAFARLAEIERSIGPIVPASVLAAGFVHQGQVIPFRSQQGIFRPRIMRGPACLSITTVERRSGPAPYDDDIGSDEDVFRYAYRRGGPEIHDNRMLRAAYREQAPIVYFKAIQPAVYAPLWPCFVVADRPDEGYVSVAVGVRAFDLLESDRLDPPNEIERRYVIRQVRQRLHQQRFRRIVLRAYAERCTVCRLREPGLLNASHIVPDRDRRGAASVPNGLALCVIHHEAYDRDLMAVTPDYRVRLSRRLLDDDDGPMLEQGLKAFHGGGITLPRRREDHPSPELLEERLAAFERVA